VPEQVVTLVRLPIQEAVEMLRRKHNISETFTEVRLEDDFLAFYFVRPSPSTEAGPEGRVSGGEVSTVRTVVTRRRRARKRRNRMKTRGWPVVGKIVNKRGQTVVIYKPFVEALSEPGISKREQRTRVEGILRENRNKPSDVSIEYFLNNTLEYLRARPEGVAHRR
jgi:hypothetical protein